MLKLTLATAILGGLAASNCLAADACSMAEDYLKAKVEVSNQDLAKAIFCLTASLPNDGAQQGAEEMQKADTIILLSNKIIGNGVARTTVVSNPPQAMISAVVISSDKTPAVEGTFSPVQAAEAIVCEVDKMLPTHVPRARAGTCSDPKGTRDEIKQQANKIIGNV